MFKVAWIGTGFCREVIHRLINGDNEKYPGFAQVYRSKIQIKGDYCRKLSPEEVQSCKSVTDIVSLLRAKAIDIRNRCLDYDACIIELVPDWEPYFTNQEYDLRDLVKVVFWKERIPTQIITRKATDSKESLKYDNLALGLYVAVGGKPWILDQQFSNIAYIGISFGQVVEAKRRLVSIVEVFDEYGQSISMRAMTVRVEENSFFYEDKDMHLSRSLLRETIEQLIGEYARIHGSNYPRQLVIHKTSNFDDDELAALTSISSESLDVLPVHVISGGSCLLNLIKSGAPPFRGSYWRITPNRALLYSSGVLQNQSRYFLPGMPHPLLVDDYSKSERIDLICRQLLYLTKLNWNSTNTYEREPVTISHARKLIRLMNAGLDVDIPSDPRFIL